MNPRPCRLLAAICVALSPVFAARPPEIPVNYDEGKVPAYRLPDPLVAADGSAVREAAAWRKRRLELLEVFSREVYGRTPAGRPAGMHWETTSVDRGALGGKAVRKEVTLWFTARRDGPRMYLLLYLPTGARGPVPAFLGYNYYGNQCVNADPGITLSQAWMRPNAEFKIVGNRATEGTRGVHASRWDIETVVARGYATATVYYGDLCEDRGEGVERDVGALFRTGSAETRSPDACRSRARRSASLGSRCTARACSWWRPRASCSARSPMPIRSRAVIAPLTSGWAPPCSRGWRCWRFR